MFLSSGVLDSPPGPDRYSVDCNMLKNGLGSYHWVLENSMRLMQDNAENHLIKHQLIVQVRAKNMVLYSILWESGMGQKCGGQGFFFLD